MDQNLRGKRTRFNALTVADVCMWDPINGKWVSIVRREFWDHKGQSEEKALAWLHERLDHWYHGECEFEFVDKRYVRELFIDT